ncbi:MAG: GMC family oxidoreductase [Chloroflexi bacterium]|nr:GMC family oxidoreductase [Chloroflexota bacterium]
MTDHGRVIVIGSGPSGAAAALSLIERGVSVTMVESGRTYPTGLVVRAFGRNLFRSWAADAERYRFTASGDPATEWQSALTPGGLSNYWTGAVPRFAPDDFTEGGRLHERYEWPVSYVELAPYYSWAERLLGVVGERRAIPQVSPTSALLQQRQLPSPWRRVAEAAERQGQGLMYSPIADGPAWMIRRSGNAFNSFDRIVSRLRRHPAFELRLGTHALRLTWNGNRGKVDGVEVADRATRTRKHLAADAVILAAGPLASPKLLLQSTSDDFPDGLGNNHGVLGRYLHDHPKDWCVLELDRTLPRLDQPLYMSRAPYAEAAPLSGASITIGPLAKLDRVLSMVGAGTHAFGLVTFATMRPVADNRIQLDSVERDQFDTPLMDIRLVYGPDVMRTVSDAHQRLLAMLQGAGYRGRIMCELDRLVPGTSAHYAGAARMHASPVYGVLDSWNRVHDALNVAVVDASSFTTAVEKNPTLTAMALAARAAARIAGDVKEGTASPLSESVHALSAVR